MGGHGGAALGAHAATAPASKRVQILVWTAVCFVFGCGAILIPSFLLETPCNTPPPPSLSASGYRVYFRAPFFVTGLLFVAHLLVLGVEWWKQSRAAAHDSDALDSRRKGDAERSFVGAAPSVVSVNPLAVTMDKADDAIGGPAASGYVAKSLASHAVGSASGQYSKQAAPGRCCTSAAVLRLLRRCVRVGPSALLHLMSRLLITFSYIYITSSTLSGLRGSIILFTAVLSWLSQTRDSPGTSWKQWACVALCTVGAAMVGVGAELETAYWPASYSTSYTRSTALGALTKSQYTGVGITMALGGFFLFSLQLIEEEKLEHLHFTIYEVIGYQGLWGLSIIGLSLGALQALYDYEVLVESAANPLDYPSNIGLCLATTPFLVWLSVAYLVVCFVFYIALFKCVRCVGRLC